MASVVSTCLFHTERSHVIYDLESEGNNLVLKISRAARVIPIEATADFSSKTDWNPTSFEVFLKYLQQTNILYAEDVPDVLPSEVVQEIRKIEAVEGDISQFLQERKALQNDEYTELEKLTQQLTDAETAYKDLTLQQDLQLQAFKKSGDFLVRYFKRCIASAQYLTEGFGQYEEHEFCATDAEKEWKLCLKDFEEKWNLIRAKKDQGILSLNTWIDQVEQIAPYFIQTVPQLVASSDGAAHENKLTLIQKMFVHYRKLKEVKQPIAHLVRTFHLIEAMEFQVESLLSRLTTFYFPEMVENQKEYADEPFSQEEAFAEWMETLAWLDNEFPSIKEPLEKECPSLNICLSQIESFLEKVRENLPRLFPTVELSREERFALIQELQSCLQKCKQIKENFEIFYEAEIAIDSLTNHLKALLDQLQGLYLFRRKLAQREVFESIDEDNEGEELIRDFEVRYQAALNKFQEWQNLDLNTIENFPEEDELALIFTPLTESFTAILTVMQNKRDFTWVDLRYDEISSNDLFVMETLDQSLETVYSAEEECQLSNKASRQLLTSCQFFKEIKIEYAKKEALFKSYSQAYNELEQHIKKISKHLKEKKGEQSIAVADKVSPSLSIDPDHLLDLLRKHRLQTPYSSSDKRKNIECKRTLLEEIRTNPENVIDLAIEWTILDRNLQNLEKKLENERRAVAAKFPANVQIPDSRPYAIAQYKRGEAPETKSCAHSFSHPFFSPLVQVVSSLCKAGLKVNQYEGFMVSSAAPLSAFEKGLFSVVLGGKNSDKFVFPSSIHKNIYKEQKTGPADENCVAPSYYSLFAWDDPDLPLITEPMTSSLRETYTLLVLKLAHMFIDPEKRKRQQLPLGNPVASLIVSQEGKILSWAVNTTGTDADIVGKGDMVRHAEVNALGAYFHKYPDEQSLPVGAVLFTSLKSCGMCAGAIHDCMSPKEGNVVYAQNDPGQKDTVLKDVEKESLLKISDTLNTLYKDLQEEEKMLAQTTGNKTTTNAAACLEKKEFSKTLAELSSLLEDSIQKNGEHLVQHVRKFLMYLETL